MRVWITRSEPGASRQAEALRNAGHRVLVAPVLSIEPTGAPVPVGKFDLVVFLSEQAVRHCGDPRFCAGARVFAVGGATAGALAAAGVQARIAEPSSSEGLLQLLAEQDVGGAAILIVAGEGGRKTLRDGLLGRGATVTEFLCYRRAPVRNGSVDPAQVDAVLVGSQDGFKAFARLWCDSGGADVQVIAASERIAALGPELGFPHVAVADGATAEDWIRALERGRGA